MKKTAVVGPTYEEMLRPEKVDPKLRARALEMKKKDPLHPVNLYNITWKDERNEPYYFVLPRELTGVEANIVVLYAKDFPSGSHKVGATYSVLMEKTIFGEVDPSVHTLVWPSTGNYGIGGAWVSSRMNYDSIVILPELMSKERFEIIKHYGARVIATPGCESNVKEIYDKSKELYQKDPKRVRILNQFSEFGNYRFHYYVTGNTMIELVKEKDLGNGRIAAVVAGVGSAGTIACADRVKQIYPEAKKIAVEPLQCPTLALNGYGGHDIQGIGDKHVTWIHNVLNMDSVVLVDDMDSKRILRLFADSVGKQFLSELVEKQCVEYLSDKLGISSIANIIGAIKIAKFYKLSSEDNILTVATDNIERYHSVINEMNRNLGQLDRAQAKCDFDRILLRAEPTWVFEGDRWTRERWHNLKYYTWVEQQGKKVEELDAQREESYWLNQQRLVDDVNKKLIEYKEAHREALDTIIWS